ncbi:MFS transporter [Leptothermofonsia sichuanensis E412]|uniref:MFS transporter n=1 Tax=Leptothermofonsia sichuanensis TaxID=2917832 RepID=UPI001CA790A7|nr:MFS transporter [Leptothermofonsia sichuanensis]QZZ19057.1 MFS transporter [Leptothermofonsia sichuanensis E412]
MKKLPATTVYLILTTASTLFSYSVFTVSAVYRVTVAGLNPLQLVLVGTALETTIFVCEIPTGVLADVHSRRLSIIIGTFLIGAGFILEGSEPTFAAILLAQVLWGIGYTFMSGAQQAWISDEVGEKKAHQVFLRGAQVSQMGGLFGTFLGVGLASYRIGLPMVAGGGLYLGLGLFLMLFMPERGFMPQPHNRRTPWKSMAHTLRGGVYRIRRQPVLMILLGVGALHGLASEGLDRLWEMHFLQNFALPGLGLLEPIVWFGIINAIASILSILGVELIRLWLAEKGYLNAAKALLVIDSLLIVSLLTFSLSHSFELALASCWATDLLRAANEPVYIAWINQKLNSATRATVFSMGSQINAIGKILGGPILGVIGNDLSIRAAIAASGMILVPVLLLYMRTLRHHWSQVTEMKP